MKSRRRAFLLLSLLLSARCLIFAVVFSANAALILNGSFENPDLSTLPDGYYNTTPSGWTMSGGGIVKGAGGGLSPYTTPLPENGNQYSLNAPGGTWIQQTFTVGIGLGGTYELTWFDNTLLPGASTPPPTTYNVFVYDSLNVAVASDTFGPFNGTSTWNARSLSMTLSAGDYRLRFDSSGTASPNYYALDNVSLDVTPVPEPPAIIAVALLLLPIGLTILRTLRGKGSSLR